MKIIDKLLQYLFVDEIFKPSDPWTRFKWKIEDLFRRK